MGYRSIRRVLAFRLLAMLDKVLPSRGTSIALYHQVIDTPSDYRIGGHVSPEAFQQQMRRLKRQGYRGISIREYLSFRDDGPQSSSKLIALTFDDGQQDVYTHAFPILKELGFSATIFVVTGYVGQGRWLDPHTLRWSDSRPHKQALYYRFMDWGQIREMHAEGFEFGSHTCTHPSLTSMPSDEMQEEIEVSKSTLERTLGNPVDTFCYPYGRFNDVVRKTVVQTGYRGACSTIHGLNQLDTDPFTLRRYGIAPITGPPFDIYLTDKYAWYYRHSWQRRGREDS